MKMGDNFASLHAYLCADGYVIKNPENQKHKYYRVGLRNTNSVLLKDFQDKFFKVFGVKPRLVEGERCEIGSRIIYEQLSKGFGSFYSNNWKMINSSSKLNKIWLRTFFDCEGWVFCKTHQNRHIGLDSINENGIDKIINALNKLGIATIKKENEKRKIYRVLIYGKKNLKNFQKKIGFLHPIKSKKLENVINDFIDYDWRVNEENFQELLREKIRIKKPYYARIISKKEENLKKISRLLKKSYGIKGKIHKASNGIGTIYYELNINKKEDIRNLIKNKIIKDVFENEFKR